MNVSLHRRRSRLERAGRWVNRFDAWLLRNAVARRSPATDEVMLLASNAANKSRLWVATSAALAVLGGSRGRRTAVRGLVSIALTSAIVNGPLKLVLRRRRPALELPPLVRMPTSFSFPSGHAASAAAFATSVLREWPAVGVPVAGAAALVGYSRIYTGVHYPGDVLVGAALGVTAGAAAGFVLRDDPGIQLPPPEPDRIPLQAVLVTSPSSGSANELGAARAALADTGIEVIDEVEVGAHRERLAQVVATPAAERPLVVVAGGDGTVGAAADVLAGTGAIMAVLPLGTSNDVARSLGIPTDPVAAARGVVDGVVRAIDAGRVVVDDGSAEGTVHNFVHAATVGFNVRFAKLATSSWLRRRFGRLTYAVAGIRALRQHQPFECELHYDGTSEKLRLVQLSIVNAPIFGGALDLRVPGARLDDRSLVVIAVEQGPMWSLLLGAVATMVGGRRQAAGVRAFHTKELRVHVERPLDVALDGEITATLPADFAVAADALHVITPRLADDRV